MTFKVKHIAEDSSLLLSKLLHSEPVDGMDSRYLNLSYHPIINLLKKILDISLYNNKFYSSTPSIVLLKFDYSNKTLAFPEHSDISDYSSKKCLYSDTDKHQPHQLQSRFHLLLWPALPLYNCILVSSCVVCFSLFNMFQIVLSVVVGIQFKFLSYQTCQWW